MAQENNALTISILLEGKTIVCNNARRVLWIALNSIFIYMSRQAYGQVAEQDSFALLALLYEAAHGDQWTDNSRWLTALPVGEWKGVAVHEGRVSALALDSNNLYGAIPVEITYLTALECLSISNNALKELPDLNAGKPAWCKLGESDPFDIVVNVDEQQSALPARLYPNPTGGMLYLDA